MRRCGRRSLSASAFAGGVHGFGGHTAHRLTRKHIFGYDSARGHNHIARDVDPRYQDRTSANKSACANSDAATQDAARRDVHTVRELALVVNARPRVNDASPAEDGIGADACVRQDLTTL